MGDDGRCTKYFPKDPVQRTYVDDEGWVHYRRRAPDDGGETAQRHGHTVTNANVVPYNPYLLLRYVELATMSSAIKYLFKVFFRVQFCIRMTLT